jgi:hypothetical protein
MLLTRAPTRKLLTTLKGWPCDASVWVLFAMVIGSLLDPAGLLSPTTPTGGDVASHVLYARLFHEEILPSGRLTAWMPEVFGGYPLLSYYFPMPFVVASLLGHAIGWQVGLKIAMVLPALLLPGLVFTLCRRALGLPLLAAWATALACCGLLVHEEHALWGGNLLSLLAGQFAYAWGLVFAWAALVGWWWAATQMPYRAGAWCVPGLLEALTGLCHGYPLLLVGAASGLLLLLKGRRMQTLRLLVLAHALAFALMGGWLWPLLEMHGYTIPNDATTSLMSWADWVPATLWPVAGAGALGAAIVGICAVLRGFHSRRPQPSLASGDILAVPSVLPFMALSSMLAVAATLVAERVGLLDIRFVPLAWLFGGVACAGLFGTTAAVALQDKTSQALLALALVCGMAAWCGPRVVQAPAWAQWNHGGLEAKPQWQNLSGLLPAMSGAPHSPRLLFEHHPDNDDLGSTRVLESLPAHLDGRPVLEGLYMESALLGPAVYQTQSEVSARPSSPLVRYPSGELNPKRAAVHMQTLHANQVLTRSKEATTALLQSGLFHLKVSQPPFSLLELEGFRDEWIYTKISNWALLPKAGWMDDSHAWFRSQRRMSAAWPVYADLGTTDPLRAAFETAQLTADINVRDLSVERHRVAFSTDGVGRPHLIKMSYHPRWELATQGRTFLAAPGFMVIVPQEGRVELVYGTTAVGKAGVIASALACGWAAWALWALWAFQKRPSPVTWGAQTESSRCTVLVDTSSYKLSAGYGAFVLAGLIALAASQSPSRTYQEAWTAIRASEHARAAELFYEAYQGRTSRAGQEEALFWSARAAEDSGDSVVALERYRTLIDRYQGYWVPESLSRVVVLAQDLGLPGVATLARQRLMEEHGPSKWAQEAARPRGAP